MKLEDFKAVLKETFESKGYKEYKHHFSDFGILYQKRVESERVCELNENLSITISPFHREDHSSLSVDIRAEYKGLWFSLSAYSITINELNRIDEIERSLIKAFNAL